MRATAGFLSAVFTLTAMSACSSISTEGVIDADFSDGPPPVKVELIKSLTQHSLRIVFQHGLHEIEKINAANFEIYRDQPDNSLEVVTAYPVEDNSRAVIIETALQEANTTYTLKLSHIYGTGGEEIQAEGLLEFFTTINLPVIIETLEVVNPTTLRVLFAHDLANTGSIGPENFNIYTANWSDYLSVYSVNTDPANARAFFISFARGQAGSVYTLQAVGLRGVDGQTTGSNGIMKTFTALSETVATLGYYFEITTTTSITDNNDFYLILKVFRDSDFSPAYSLQPDASLSLETGSGAISETASTAWQSGQRTFTLKYTAGLAVGTTENIAIKAVSTDEGGIESGQQAMVVLPDIRLSYFTVTTPTSAVAGQPFNAVITAMANNDQPYTAYSGPLDINPSTDVGTLGLPLVIDSFFNGQVTVPLSYNTVVSGLKVIVTDSQDATITGQSTDIQVNPPTGSGSGVVIQGLQVLALPGNTNRLSWVNPSATQLVELYEETSPGNYTLLDTLTSAQKHYHHTGLTAAQNYSYKIIYKDASNNPLKEETASATAAGPGCPTTIAGGTISSVTTWTTANAPYCITADLTITSLLDIERGVQVLLSPGAGITVGTNGILTVQNTGSGMVHFTTSSTADPPARHDGITFNSDAVGTSYVAGSEDFESGSVLRHFIYDFASTAVYTNTPMLVKDCMIRNNNGTGLHFNAINSYVHDCVFQSNSGSTGGGLHVNGQNQGTTAIVRNSLFEYNSANDGGAIYSRKDIVIYNSVFQYNRATTGSGGAFAKPSHRSMAIHSSVFTANTANSNGGALESAGNGGFVLTNSTFENNSANTGNGGALYIPMNSGVTITGSTFSGNTAALAGGAADIDQRGGTISGNTFISNSAVNGGAFRMTGSTCCGGAMFVTNNHFFENEASSNGGALWADIRGDFNYNTFSGNTAAGLGGAIYRKPNHNQRSLNYNFFYGNTAGLSGGAAYIADTGDSLTEIITHNLFDNSNSAGDDSFALYSADGDTLAADLNFWGATWADKQTGGICDADAANTAICSGSPQGTVSVTNQVDTPWPLCSDSPADADCVGADFVP